LFLTALVAALMGPAVLMVIAALTVLVAAAGLAALMVLGG
jgi:hypothetical protein